MLVRLAITAFLSFAFWPVLSPAPVRAADTLLIPAGSVWKYRDDGSNQGTAWRAAGFNDSTWASGLAQLGYGEGDEATLLSFGPDANNKHITTYFRKTFNVANPSQFTGLILNMIRDDGAIVYVNGVEVWRLNVGAGNIAYDRAALTSVVDETVWQTVSISSSMLVSGANTIAVEMHQDSGTSDDLSFDFSLSGTDTVFLTRQPYLQSGTHDSVIVRWRTNVATDSEVRFGTTLGTLTETMTDGTFTTEHALKLTGLTPDTKYFYQVGSTSGGLSGNDSATYFYTSPVPGTVRPYRFWVIGDAGTGNTYQMNVRDAYTAFNGSARTDAWLMLGDNAYDSGLDSEYQNAVFGFYPSMVRTVVSWPVLGNHDTANLTTAPPSLPYFQMFSLPTNGEAGGSPSGTEHYYSFDYGNVHFVALDSMVSSRSATGPMANWLRADLAQNTKRWTVAMWHHPPYSFGTHDSDSEIELAEMRANFVPILEDGGVDLVLSGHSHSNERSYLIDGHYGTSSTFTSGMRLNATGGPYNKPGLQPHEGTVYIVAGNGGRFGALFPYGPYPAMYRSSTGAGSLVLDVDGDRLDVRLLTDAGAIADTVTINKGVVTPPAAPGGLTVTAVSASQINLAWADNSNDENGFTIERSTDGVNFTPIAVTPPQTTAFSNTGLAAATLYYYRVFAYNTAGNSAAAAGSATTAGAGPPPPDITTGLRGHWALNETAGTTAADASGNNNAGTLINGPAWTSAGQVGGALAFDGVNDYVSLGKPASLMPGAAITLAAWVKLNDLSINRFVVAKYDGPAQTFLRYEKAQGIKCVIGGTGVVAPVSVVTGQWYHAGCTYDGATIRVYVNGVQVATGAKTGAIGDTGTAWGIGAAIAANGTPLAFMNGLIDDVRLYNRALTAAEISLLSNPGVPDTTPPVLSNGGPSGTLAAGTTQATLTVATNENASCRYATVAGIAYAAMPGTFATSGGTAHSTAVTGLTNGNTYTFFVRCLDTPGNATTTDYAISFAVAAPADTTPPVLSNGGPSGTLAAGTTQATLTVATNENATCRYATVAGTAYAAMPGTFATSGGTAHSTVVTGLTNGNTYTFFVRCLDTPGNATTADYPISFAVAASPPPPDITTGLRGHWALNETAGTTAADASGNNNAGTLINGPAWTSAGQVGGALAFDGVNDYVSLGKPASLMPGAAITLAAWVKLNDLSINRFVVAKYDGPAQTFLRYEKAQGIKCVIGGTGVVAPVSVVTGQWYHAGCTYDGATIRVYVNGVQVATGAKTGAIGDTGTAWGIGAAIAANGTPLAFMNGLIDDVRLYNRALTAAEIALLFAQ